MLRHLVNLKVFAQHEKAFAFFPDVTDLEAKEIG